MKKMTYKTRRSLHRILTVLLIVGMALALFSFCWNIWVARYVVYTREGATLDFTRGPLPDNAVIAQQPKADENVSIYYNEGSDAVELSQELSSVNGYYIDYDVLKQGNFEEIKTDLNRLKAGTAIMIELKGGYGSFYYTSGLTGAVSSASVNTTAVDELIQYVRSKGFYMIAKISAFRDYDFGNRNVTSGLYMKSRAGLWADSGGCYWMDPTSANTLGWITSIVNEVHSLASPRWCWIISDSRRKRTSISLTAAWRRPLPPPPPPYWQTAARIISCCPLWAQPRPSPCPTDAQDCTSAAFRPERWPPRQARSPSRTRRRGWCSSAIPMIPGSMPIACSVPCLWQRAWKPKRRIWHNNKCVTRQCFAA